MKLNILPIFIAAALGTARAADIKTLDGKQYKNVTVSRVEPDGIVITASYGIIKLPFEELPKDVQAKYGFDASRAAKFRQQVNAAADARERETAAAQKKLADELELANTSPQLAPSRTPGPKGWATTVNGAQNGLIISPAKNAGLRIEHESYGKLLSEAKTKATNLNYNQDRTNALISGIPAGGRLILHIERSTIEAAKK